MVRKPIALATLLLLIAAARWHSYDEPMERDIAVYSVIGSEMLKGRALYADLWDLKPPGIYLVNAFARAVTPGPRAAVYLLAVAAAFVTMLGIAYITARFEPKWLWLWAAACWVAVSGDYMMQANQPNVEVFMNAGIVWFLVLCTGAGVRRGLKPGVLALTSLFKQVVVATGFFLAIAFVATAPPGKRGEVLGEWLRIAAVGLLFWLVVLLVFLFTGTFDEFYQAVFQYGDEYSGSVLGNIARSFQLPRLLPAILTFLWPLAVLTVIGIAAGWRKPETRRFSAIVLCLCAATQVQIAMPGKFFPHYYQLWLPVLVVGAAWGLSMILALTGSTRVAMSVAAAVLVLVLQHELSAFRLTAEQWSFNKYKDEFILDQRMGQDLRAILQPGESFYHWGNQVSLYFETEISPPTGLFFSIPFHSPIIGQQLATRVFDELQARKPELFVESSDWDYPSDPVSLQMLQWLRANYEPIEPNPRHTRFRLYARKGTALHQRQGIPAKGP